MSLIADRSNPKSGTIITKEILTQYKMIHEFLQSIHVKTKFHNTPFSMFIFKLHLHPNEDSKYDYSYSDNQERTQVAVQIGEIGLICCFGEDGIVAESLNDFIKPFQKHTLHPIQFAELVATIFYRRYCLKFAPNYLLVNGQGDSHIVSQLNSFSGLYFNEYKSKEFALFFAHQLDRFGYDFDDIYVKDSDLVKSFLLNEKDEIYLLDKKGIPIEKPEILNPKIFH